MVPGLPPAPGPLPAASTPAEKLPSSLHAEAATGVLQPTPADGAEASAFRASQSAELRLAPLRDGASPLSDAFRHVDKLSTDVNNWFRQGEPGAFPVPDPSADPAAQMRDLYEFASRQFLDNSMLSMKLNVTNQEMEALNKDKDQLMRGGS